MVYGIFHLLLDRKNAYVFAQKSDRGDKFSYFQGGGFQRHMQTCLSHMPLRVKCISMVIEYGIWNKFEWPLSVTKAIQIRGWGCWSVPFAPECEFLLSTIMFRSFCFYDLSKVFFLGVCARKSNPQLNHLCTIRRLIFLLHAVSINF